MSTLSQIELQKKYATLQKAYQKLSSEFESTKKIEDEKKTAIAYLENIVACIPGNLYWKSKDGVYLGCNDYSVQTARISRSDFVGKTDYELWDKEAADQLREHDKLVMESNKSLTREETVTLPNGERIYFTVVKMPLRNEKGETIGVVGNSIEITELKRTQQALEEAKKRAEIANKTKSQFLATMSHELRTPLNAILGMTQVLEDSRLNPEQQEYINLIQQAGTHLLLLINDILDFAKIEAGKLSIEPEPFDLYELVKEVVATLRHNAELKGLKLLSAYDDKAPHAVIADPKRIRQIIVNLIGNATKFTESGHIEMTVKLIEQTSNVANIRFTVKDTGIGIPEDKLAMIFERFSQVESKYNRRFEGAGLGLAICKQLIEAMRGKIGVQSISDKGSTFWFEIPFPFQSLHVKRKPLIKRKEPAKLYKISHKHRLLLIEDNILNQKVAQVMFQNYSCTLDIANNGEQGLRMLSKHNYSLVFTDIGLPDIDGITVIQRIRSLGGKYKKLPIIAMTAHVMREDIAAFLNAGANDIVTKPIMQDRLRDVLTQYLSK